MDLITRGRAAAKAAAKDLPGRIRALHEARYGCGTWETWTERNVLLMEGYRADVDYDGCRTHGVKVAR